MSNPFVNRIINYGTKAADQFQANPLNWRTHPQKQRDAVQASLRELGWIGVVVENKRTGNLIDGHERVWQAMKNNEPVPYIEVDLSEEEERLALATFDPITYMAETDAGILDALLREVNTGEDALQELLASMAEDNGLYPDEGTAGAGGTDQTRATLAERFVIPPFSVLDARQGYWQERKRAWIALGIQSELGRGEAVTWGVAPSGVGTGEHSGTAYTDAARKAAPGGSPRDAATLGKDGKTVRGDGRGKPMRKPNVNSNVVNTIDGKGLKIDADRRQSKANGAADGKG